MMAAEENMKKLKRDIDVYQDTPEKSIKLEGKTVSRGTRNLMKEIQEELGNSEESISDEDFDSEKQTDM